MNTNDLTALYADRKSAFEHQIKTLNQRVTLISWSRVAVGIAVVVLFYFSLQITLLWWLTILALIGYSLLVGVHQRNNYQKKLFQNLIIINDGELSALGGDYAHYTDGSEFASANHPYALDLDIFGSGSLYQRLNRTSTEQGGDRLAQMISVPLKTHVEITDRQTALKELSEKLDYRQNFYAVGLASSEKKEDKQKLLDWLHFTPLVYGKKSLRIALFVFPALSLISLIYWIVTSLALPFVVVTLIQWGIVGTYVKRVTLMQNYIGSQRYLLEKFAGHFALMSTESFTAKINQDIKHQSTDAQKQIKRLADRSRALDLRLNLFAGLLLNSTMLYDLFAVYRLEQWREENRDHLANWLRAIEEADALNSLATYVFNHPHFVFPEINDSLTFHGEALGHPLLKAEVCVRNSIRMDGANVWIVTGANMAGKSTFLRTVGMNTVMALSGLTVFAEKFVCPLLEVYSGMRNTDSINDNQSYFFAELLRLQNIVNQLREGKQLLILLDEILKGTNSVDKLSGSEALVKQLVTQPCLSLIATHDVALGDMEKEFSNVRNHHFETFINGDELSFDYKVKPGVSTGKNATFLMKKMGIIA